MTRAYTKAEVRQQFLRHVADLVDYYEQESRAPSTRKKLEGLAFSLLVALDGMSGWLRTKFIVAPDPHPEDKEYRRRRGQRWFPETERPRTDISGELHDDFAALLKRRRRSR